MRDIRAPRFTGETSCRCTRSRGDSVKRETFEGIAVERFYNAHRPRVSAGIRPHPLEHLSEGMTMSRMAKNGQEFLAAANATLSLALTVAASVASAPRWHRFVTVRSRCNGPPSSCFVRYVRTNSSTCQLASGVAAIAIAARTEVGSSREKCGPIGRKRGNNGARIIISYVMARLGEEIAAVMREAVTSRA